MVATRCGDCGLSSKGSSLCSHCGATHLAGGAPWICFPCGRQNPFEGERCACGRERTLECRACEAEVPFRAEACHSCGTPRFAFEAAREAMERTLEVRMLRERARLAALLAAPLAAVGVLLAAAGQRTAVKALGGGLVGCALVGCAQAVTASRSARRLVH